MKKMINKVVIVLILIIILCGVVFLSGCSLNLSNESYLRIHIRANSNSEVDQNIKYVVKESVIEYITPYVASVSSKKELEDVLSLQKSNIETHINSILIDNGLDYKSNMKINNEYFPTRSYDGYTLPADYYDAVVIELGSGSGDNWWCVVYPPLCFTNNEQFGKGVVYKSKIVEIINKFFGV